MLNQGQQTDFDKDFYDRHAAQFEALHGEMTPAADAVLKKAARLELLIQKASDDIDAKGLKETVRNGRQTFLRDNKSLAQMLKIMSQQTSLLQALKLLPSRRSASSKDDDEEDGDPEGELDNY